MARAAGPGVAGVVSLLALDEGPAAGWPVVPGGLAGSLALVQGLGDAGISAPLWAVTRGAVAAGPGEVLASPVQAMVWGLGLAAAAELPDRWGGLVDVPAVLDERAGARLCSVLAGCGEDQVAVRAAGVMGRRLVRAPLPGGGGAGWPVRGTVLVTGGTGAAGGRVARWAAGRGAARVVLASRSGPGAAGAAVLAAGVAGSGARAEVLACDVADRGQVAGLLGRVAAGGPGLRVVVHAAGAGQAAVLPDATIAGLAGVVAAGAGAAYLDELTAGAGLDAFVVFSSAAATWGGAGLGGYAAAGAFGGAVVQARRGRGLAGTSVAWGPWGGAGEDGAGWRRRGLGVLDPGLAVAALGEVLGGGEQVVTVADVDWARFAPGFTVRRPSPLLGGVPEAGAALAAAAAGRPGRPRRGVCAGAAAGGVAGGGAGAGGG